MSKHFRYHDGGRSAAGYRGKAGDCVVRSIAIATGLPYQHIYDLINRASTHERTGNRKRGKSNARTGVYKSTIKRVMTSLGWIWTPTMQIGSGCTVHLRSDELPGGRLLVSVSKHLTAVVDGVIHDTHDCSRRGTRCVYGYWQPPTSSRAQRELHFEPREPAPANTSASSRTSPRIDRVAPPGDPSPAPARKPNRPHPSRRPPRRKSFLEWLFT
jgi:hypothetical protein